MSVEIPMPYSEIELLVKTYKDAVGDMEHSAEVLEGQMVVINEGYPDAHLEVVPSDPDEAATAKATARAAYKRAFMAAQQIVEVIKRDLRGCQWTRKLN